MISQKNKDCPRLWLWEDKPAFFKSMEDDWQHLAQYGIGREVYEEVLAELREAGAEASES